jgi:homoserine dehydrogenase
MLKIGILGAGTVGSGVVKVLKEKQNDFSNKIGSEIVIKSIAVKDKNKNREHYFKGIYFTENPSEIVNDPEIDIIVELIGGVEPARELIFQAINNGKHIVTANKEVIAKHGNEIFELAHEKKVLVYIEGSVAGGIPIIQTLKRDLIANKIISLMGIINGTTNYILTEMTQKKRSFADVLKEAQDLGFAEADPASDIEGFDPVYKLSIIASLIFGHKINVDEIYREGITKISVQDIEYANKLGYIIKLLAIAKQHDDGTYEARVHPTMLPVSHPLASVNGSFNAIWLNGDSVGDFMLYGRGAGQLPTASAVVADILNLALEMKLRNPLTITQDKEFLKISSMDRVVSQYYIRMLTADRPGVMGIIGRDLGISEVSIGSIWQSNTDGATAEIVLITHPVSEAKMNKAIALLKSSEGIKEISSLIRVE